MRVVNSRRLFKIIANLDDHVVMVRRGVPKHTPWRPVGGKAAKLPREYVKWADGASEDDLERFWDFVVRGYWKQAKKLSGLPEKVIVEMMAAAAEDTGYSGSVSAGGAHILGMPLERFRAILEEVDGGQVFKKYANSKKRYHELDTNERLTMAMYADAVNDAIGGWR